MPSDRAVLNLGPKQKRKRMILGITAFLLGGALGTYFVFQETPGLYRLLVWPLFFIAMLGFFQAKERTCVILSWKRVQHLDSSETPIADCSLSQALIMKSQKIVLQAVLLSFALTLACLFS